MTPPSRRWLVLVSYMLVAALSQALWLNFAPLLSLVQKTYGVSELVASTLVMVFPLLYVLVSVPAGTLTDRKGYRFTIGLGAVLMALCSALRIYDRSFAALLAGQIGVALAQPLVVNGITKLVADWFEERQGALATGLGTMGMFLGMAAGMAATPPLVEALGLRGAMIAFTGASVAVAGLFLALVRPNPRGPAAASSDTAPRGMRQLLRDRDLLLVCLLGFVGLGFFNGLTTWLEQILAPNGVSAVDAGMVGGMLVIGGIIGAVVIPALSDRFRRRKPFVLLCTAVALATVYPLCASGHYATLLVLAALLGFFFLPAYALLLEMSAELAGPAQAGSATGLLMLAGNAGGVAVIVSMQAVKGDAPTYRAAVFLLLGLLATGLLVAALVRETYRRRTAE